MIVSFATEELATLCNSGAALDKRFGRQRAQQIRQRLFEIAGTPSVERLTRLPALGCGHRVTAGREQVVVRIDAITTLVVEGVPAQAGVGEEVVIVELIHEADR